MLSRKDKESVRQIAEDVARPIAEAAERTTLAVERMVALQETAAEIAASGERSDQSVRRASTFGSYVGTALAVLAVGFSVITLSVTADALPHGSLPQWLGQWTNACLIFGFGLIVLSLFFFGLAFKRQKEVGSKPTAIDSDSVDTPVATSEERFRVVLIVASVVSALFAAPALLVVWRVWWLGTAMLVVDAVVFAAFYRMAKRYWVGLLFVPALVFVAVKTLVTILGILLPLRETVTLMR